MSELRMYRGRTRAVDLSENGLAHKLASWGLACQLLSVLFLLPVAGGESYVAESGNTFLAQVRIILYGLDEASADHINKTEAHTADTRPHSPLADVCCADGGGATGVLVSVRGKDMELKGIPVPSSIQVHLTDETVGHTLSVSVTSHNVGATGSDLGEHRSSHKPEVMTDRIYGGDSVTTSVLYGSWPFQQ